MSLFSVLCFLCSSSHSHFQFLSFRVMLFFLFFTGVFFCCIHMSRCVFSAPTVLAKLLCYVIPQRYSPQFLQHPTVLTAHLSVLSYIPLSLPIHSYSDTSTVITVHIFFSPHCRYHRFWRFGVSSCLRPGAICSLSFLVSRLICSSTFSFFSYFSFFSFAGL